jgi:hypothetical protein
MGVGSVRNGADCHAEFLRRVPFVGALGRSRRTASGGQLSLDFCCDKALDRRGLRAGFPYQGLISIWGQRPANSISLNGWALPLSISGQALGGHLAATSGGVRLTINYATVTGQGMRTY